MERKKARLPSGKKNKTPRAIQTRGDDLFSSRHAEAMLAEAQRIFHIGSWEWDLTSGEIIFSEEMYRIVGMIPYEKKITRSAFKKLFPRKSAEEIMHKFEHSILHPFASIEHTIKSTSGYKQVHTRIKAYRDEKGNALRLLGTTQDITEQKIIEEALRTAEADYRAIFENAPVGIFRSTRDGKFIKVNKTMARMYGYPSPEEMIAEVKSIALQTYANPAEREHFQRMLSETGEVRGLETLDRRKDGSSFWTSMDARVIKTQNGEVLHYEGFITDITARKENETALQTANEELLVQLEEIRELQISLHEQATHDQLTGLYNRRYMHEILAKEYSRARREGYPISIIVLDLDHLKSINTQYGHFTGGDVALQVLGRHLQNMVKKEGVVCRYGGDEFVISLHNTNARAAGERAEKWRKALSKIQLESNHSKFRITFSAGVASFPHNGSNSESVMLAADKALYRAKELGRNRVVVYQE